MQRNNYIFPNTAVLKSHLLGATKQLTVNKTNIISNTEVFSKNLEHSMLSNGSKLTHSDRLTEDTDIPSLCFLVLHLVDAL